MICDDIGNSRSGPQPNREATSQLQAKPQDFLSGPLPAPPSQVRADSLVKWAPGTRTRKDLSLNPLLCPRASWCDLDQVVQSLQTSVPQMGPILPPSWHHPELTQQSTQHTVDALNRHPNVPCLGFSMNFQSSRVSVLLQKTCYLPCSRLAPFEC